MKANEDKCHILLSTNKNVLVNIGTVKMQNSNLKELLGVKIVCILNSKNYTVSIIKKSSAKLNVLTSVSEYIGLDKKAYHECFLFVSTCLLSSSIDDSQ